MAKARQSTRDAVPRSVQVQLSRLFGETSNEAKATARSSAEWKRTLRHVLSDLERYLDENVSTDEVHRFMLATGLWAARESLKEKEFWPGYAEGVTRFALLLLGDYPDHRKQRLKGKRKGHYNLKRLRTVVYAQTHEQKVKALFAASSIGLPKMSSEPVKLWRRYVAQTQSPTYRQFLQWFRKNHPEDYAASTVRGLTLGSADGPFGLRMCNCLRRPAADQNVRPQWHCSR